MAPHRGQPDHTSVVGRLEAWLDTEVAHKNRKVLGEVSVEGGRHGVRLQREEWNFMVGRP